MIVAWGRRFYLAADAEAGADGGDACPHAHELGVWHVGRAQQRAQAEGARGHCRRRKDQQQHLP